MTRRLFLMLGLSALAGCGSDPEQPPPAQLTPEDEKKILDEVNKNSNQEGEQPNPM